MRSSGVVGPSMRPIATDTQQWRGRSIHVVIATDTQQWRGRSIHVAYCYRRAAPNSTGRLTPNTLSFDVVIHKSDALCSISQSTDTESDVARKQQRVMIIGNNNVFEVGCCILSVHVVFIFISAFAICCFYFMY